MFSLNLCFSYSVFIESDKHFQLSNDSSVQLGAGKYSLLSSSTTVILSVLPKNRNDLGLTGRGSNCV